MPDLIAYCILNYAKDHKEITQIAIRYATAIVNYKIVPKFSGSPWNVIQPTASVPNRSKVDLLCKNHMRRMNSS